MPTEIEYQEKISQYNLSHLVDLWQAIEARETPGWEAGKAFEYLILRAFELEGAEIRWPYRVKMGGDEIEQIDGIVYADGLACLVESKDQIKPVNVDPHRMGNVPIPAQKIFTAKQARCRVVTVYP